MSYLRNPFRDASVLLQAIPQLARAFATAPIVPTDYLCGDMVRCVCGSVTGLTDGQIVECAGECGRFFLPVKGRVRAARLMSGRDEAAA